MAAVIALILLVAKAKTIIGETGERRSPWEMFYMVELTRRGKKSAIVQMHTLKYLMETLKLIVVVDLSYMTINSLMGKSLSGWFTIIVLVAVFGDLIFWIVRLYQVK